MSELNDRKRIGSAPETPRLDAHRAPEALAEHYADEPPAAPVAESYPVVENPSRSILGAGSAAILLLVTVVVAGLLLIATHGGRTEYERPANTADAFYMGPTRAATPGTPVTAGERLAAVFATSPRAAAAAMGQPVAATDEGSAAATDIPVVVYLFNYDSNNVPENEQLTDLAEALSATGRDVAIVAYTDPRGSEEYNRRLSERRAAAIGDYLAAHGVDRRHITTRGGGVTDAYPTAALDRRAVITPQ